MQVFQVISHRKTCAKELGQPRGLLTALGQRHKGLSCGPTFLAMSPTEMHPQVQRSPTPAALVLRLGNAQHSLRWAGEGVMGVMRHFPPECPPDSLMDSKRNSFASVYSLFLLYFCPGERHGTPFTAPTMFTFQWPRFTKPGILVLPAVHLSSTHGPIGRRLPPRHFSALPFHLCA